MQNPEGAGQPDCQGLQRLLKTMASLPSVGIAGHGRLGCQAKLWSLRERDGTVGRSDATEGSRALHWEVDPVRVMRPRFADSIRASSRFGLHRQIP